jgi:hypothetical protein
MKGAIAFAAAALLLFSGSGTRPASGDDIASNPDFLSLRARGPLADRFSLAEIQDEPRKFEGQLLEVRGVLTGVFDVNPRASLVLRAASGRSWTVALPQRTLQPDWGFIRVGEDVRLLCRVESGSDELSPGYLQLVSPIRESDFERAEEVRAQELLDRVQRADRLRQLELERKRQAVLKHLQEQKRHQEALRLKQQAWAQREQARIEKSWRDRPWAQPGEDLRGTWEMEGFLAVVNARESGVYGPRGESVGRWLQADRYLEFRIPGAAPYRFRWSLSDDHKALTLSRINPGGSVVTRVTLLRR